MVSLHPTQSSSVSAIESDVYRQHTSRYPPPQHTPVHMHIRPYCALSLAPSPTPLRLPAGPCAVHPEPQAHSPRVAHARQSRLDTWSVYRWWRGDVDAVTVSYPDGMSGTRCTWYGRGSGKVKVPPPAATANWRQCWRQYSGGNFLPEKYDLTKWLKSPAWRKNCGGSGGSLPVGGNSFGGSGGKVGGSGGKTGGSWRQGWRQG
ncbi:hypothetical protein C8R43DRAFT_961598 [Mycena crocata]|nr:hypothetical protein C8R43DRAFT_961598 [Mycena crocata]